MEKITEKIEVERYKTIDGKIFDDEESAYDYERHFIITSDSIDFLWTELLKFPVLNSYSYDYSTQIINRSEIFDMPYFMIYFENYESTIMWYNIIEGIMTFSINHNIKAWQYPSNLNNIYDYIFNIYPKLSIEFTNSGWYGCPSYYFENFCTEDVTLYNIGEQIKILQNDFNMITKHS